MTSLLLSLFLLYAPHQDAATERLLDALPRESLVVVATAPWDTIRARAEDNAWTRFLGDEVWRPLREHGLAWFREELGEEPDAEAPTLAEVLDLVHGPLALAIEDGEGTFLVLVEPRDPGFARVRDWMRRQMEGEAPENTSVREHAGTSILLLADPDGGDRNATLFEVDGIYGLAASDELEHAVARTHEVIDRLRGGETGGFGASPAARAARQTAGRTPAVSVMVDLQRAVMLMLEDMGSDDEERSLLGELGLLDLEWAYANADLGRGEDYEATFGVSVPEDTLLADFVDFLGPVPREMLARLPEESTGVMLFHYDVWGAWNLLLEVMANFGPDAYGEIQTNLTALKAAMDIDVEADLLSQITGHVALSMQTVAEDEVLDPAEDLGLDPGGVRPISLGNMQGMAWVVDVRDAQAVDTVLEKLIGVAGLGAEVEVLELDGHRYRSLGPGGPLRFLWAPAPRTFVYTNQVSVLSAVLRSTHEPREEVHHLARFGRLLGDVGADVSFFGAQDTSTLVAAYLETFGVVGAILAAESQALEDFDWPDAELARQYFSGTLVTTLAREPGGLVYRLVSR